MVYDSINFKKSFLFIENNQVLIDMLKLFYYGNNLMELVVKSFYDEAIVELKSKKQYDLIILDISPPTSPDDFNNSKNLKVELINILLCFSGRKMKPQFIQVSN
jgi:hypothetical protein